MQTPWIDGHLDLASLAVQGRDVFKACTDQSLGCISLPDLKESPIRTVFGTIFTAPAAGSHTDEPCEYVSTDDAFRVGIRQLDVYEDLARAGAITLLKEEMTVSETDLGVWLLMEGAEPIRSPDDVKWWHDRGVRIVGLTWSRGTTYAGGNACTHGLTDAGRDLIAALDDHRIVHDLSHCSDQAVEDLFGIATGPIVATHSNSRTVLGSDKQRHLRDDHALELFARGGVVGLNLYGAFLANNRRATIDDCVEHVLHFCELAGNTKHVALGSDYDGGFTPNDLPRRLEHPRDLPLLGEALSNAGFTSDDLRGFACENWLRFFNPSSLQ
jgi:membrane dipeptidase